MTTVVAPNQQQFVFDDVDWQFYDSVLQRLGERHVFVTYDRGRLEVMSPSFRHDRRARLIGLLINVLAEELQIPIQGGGSTTFRREDLDKGLEPDECFYVANVERIRGKDEIDLAVDPAPDIAIEVEISRRMIDRVPLYESLGVRELWRDDGEQLRIFELDPSGKYRASQISLSFPTMPVQEISRLLNIGASLDEMNWTRAVRAWVQKNLSK